jgi:predicted anti-sigma-YlaC factor YlaD
MICEEARGALSARLDGEPIGVSADQLDKHLTGCAACRTWLVRAEEVTDQVRAFAPRVPELVVRVPKLRRPWQPVRWGVAAAAAIQLALAVPELLSGLGLGGHGHASHETASFDVALAVGFLAAAYRPRLAQAYLPVALVLSACLLMTGAVDLVNGRVSLAHELGHLIAPVQTVLLWALARANRTAPSARRGGNEIMVT